MLRYENPPHTQGALFCRTGTWLEIGNSPLINEFDNRYENDYLLNKNSKHKKHYVRGIKNENSKYSKLNLINAFYNLL